MYQVSNILFLNDMTSESGAVSAHATWTRLADSRLRPGYDRVRLKEPVESGKSSQTLSTEG
jgi:hypothetical protein